MQSIISQNILKLSTNIVIITELSLNLCQHLRFIRNKMGNIKIIKGVFKIDTPEYFEVWGVVIHVIRTLEKI